MLQKPHEICALVFNVSPLRYLFCQPEQFTRVAVPRQFNVKGLVFFVLQGLRDFQADKLVFFVHMRLFRPLLKFFQVIACRRSHLIILPHNRRKIPALPARRKRAVIHAPAAPVCSRHNRLVHDDFHLVKFLGIEVKEFCSYN